jgi:hypothetical protein
VVNVNRIIPYIINNAYNVILITVNLANKMEYVINVKMDMKKYNNQMVKLYVFQFVMIVLNLPVPNQVNVLNAIKIIP